MINPWMILGAIAVAFSVYLYGHHAGYAQKETEDQLEIARLNDEARQKEQELNKQLNNQSTQLQEANNAVTQKQFDLDRAIRSGRVRLPSSSCVQTSTSARSPDGNSNDAGSESDQATLRAIAEIAAAGDKAINQLNACIAAYNQVKEAVNGQR
jgi:prophage endopeptidase